MAATRPSTTVTSMLRFAHGVPAKAPDPNTLGSVWTAGLCVPPSHIRRARNRAMPGPSRLSAMPETFWSALNVTAATACSSAKAPPARPAIKKPSHALPVKNDVAAPARAPMVIMPSIPILTTPERSEITPPSAPNTSGVAYIRVMPMSRVMLLSIVGLLLHGNGCDGGCGRGCLRTARAR